MSIEFSKQPNFIAYTYTDKDTGQTYTSPFEVFVMGVRAEILGIGMLIGALQNDEVGELPVISIDDQGEVVELLGPECRWKTPVDETIHKLLATDSAAQATVRATTYVQYLHADTN